LLLHLTEQVQSLFDPIRFFREARQHGSRYPRALSPQCPIDSWKRSQLSQLSQLTRLDSEKIHGAENPPTTGLLNRKIIYEWWIVRCHCVKGSILDPRWRYTVGHHHFIGLKLDSVIVPFTVPRSCVGNAFLHHADHAANIS
jgi:hypothetical protein